MHTKTYVIGYDRKCVPISNETAQDDTLTIQSSVGRRGANRRQDVIDVQTALNDVPPSDGGPPQALVTDGLSGKKTEEAIYGFQTKQFGASKADARIDPGHRTHKRLSELQADSTCHCPSQATRGVVASRFAANSSSNNSPAEIMARAGRGLVLAISWTMLARQQIAATRDFLSGSMSRKSSFDLVDRCFKIKGLSKPDAVKALKQLDEIFALMQKAAAMPGLLTRGAGTQKCKEGAFGWAYTTGFHRKDPKKKKIYICTANSSKKNEVRMADLIVHEMAHLVSLPARPIGHGGGAKPAGGLDALKLDHKGAMISASNYAWLAWLARLPESQWMTNQG